MKITSHDPIWLAILVLWIVFTIHVAWPLDRVSPLEMYDESSGWGFRRDVMGGARDTFHGGVDLVAPAGTRIRAAAAGIVRETWFRGWRDGIYYPGHSVYGVMVLIEHADTSVTRYGHLSEILTHEGEHVIRGRTIGIIGNTGISTGRHLHFEHLSPPEIPASVVPADPMDLFWRRLVMGFVIADQEATGD